ncbi:MAG TPA: hypothetical protein VHG32_02270 [Thermoanaerobaculia bacterium]|jgi:hypothetical protein|nr:hypothetical protein [Thermoanaerobaculia bacterium]
MRRNRRGGPVTLCTPLLLAALFLPLHAGAAAASPCHQEAVPAATLLLPYFELDLNNPNGLTTLFSINNASASAVLAHVVIWSDLAVPMLNFNVYLTGFDVQTINLRDVIVYGNLPQTASMGQDPGDTISPHGALSQDLDFATCQGQLPPQSLAGSLLTSLQRALIGLPSPMLENLCAGQSFGDQVARGYITVDTVNNCTVRFPGDAGYFGPSNPDVTDQNVLWGSWYIINATQGYAQGSDMVAVVADPASPETTTPGRYTFYGRYVGWTAADHRAPLATTFAAQFANGGPFNGGTDLLIWRDTKIAQGPFSCPVTPGLRPAWYPLGEEALVVFDEQEHPQLLPPICPFRAQPQPFDTPSQCPPEQPIYLAPAAAQRTRVGGASFPVPFTFGWAFLDLNWANFSAVGPVPPVDPTAAQAWVIATQSSNLHFAVALDAYRLDSACNATHFVP